MITTKRKALQHKVLRAGFNGAQFASELGVSRPYMSNILNGRRNVTAPLAKKICTVLGADFDELFEIDGEKSEVI